MFSVPEFIYISSFPLDNHQQKTIESVQFVDPRDSNNTRVIDTIIKRNKRDLLRDSFLIFEKNREEQESEKN